MVRFGSLRLAEIIERMPEAIERDSLELLLIADVHFVRQAKHECPIPARNAAWGIELVRRTIRRTQREAPLDAVVLMGDLVDNGEAPGAEKDLAALRDEVRSLGIPIIVVPGNHDGGADRLLRIFGDRPGVHRMKGYQLITFVDPYQPNDEASRSEQDLGLPPSAASAHPDEPIIALQHNPVHPPIESTYPYNLTNAREVMRSYAQAGVLLSVSAHYHPGIPPETIAGVTYATCPALCEAPMRFVRISATGREVSLREVSFVIENPPAPLIDYHVHTHYAYCADDVNPTASIERAEAFGLHRIYLTEHAGQLYLSADDYWSGRFREDAGLIPSERAAGRDRMRRYREEARALRSDRVGLGLEVELDADRELTLLDEDRDEWDVLIGAVHALPAFRDEGAPAGQRVREFMDETERVVSLGVDILAHPFRIFRRRKHEIPTDLYGPVADLLATHGAAAEVNYHTNEPDPRFFEICLERGVKIALGSDGHGLWEVGELAPHLDLLGKIVSPDELPGVLYVPPG